MVFKARQGGVGRIRSGRAGTQGSALAGGPVNTVTPVVTGTPLVGSVLTVTNGTWTGNATIGFTYQWQWTDTGASISGATSSTYTLVSGDVGHLIACMVTGTNGVGAATAVSNRTALFNAQHGVRTQNGNTTDNATYETWLGKSTDQVMAFANGTTWSNLQSNATANGAQGSNYKIHWSIGIPPTTTLANVASGVDDAQFITLANTILAARSSQTLIPVRVLWEFNVNAFAWYAVGNEANYIAAFQRIVGLFTSVSSKFSFEWCPNHGGGVSYDLSLAYPGDAYVDVIGMDFYYIPSFDGTDPVAAMRAKHSASYGLNWLTAFCRTHGKPMSTSEWGVGADAFGPYVSSVSEFQNDATLAYANYFDLNNGSDFLDRLSNNQYPTSTGPRYIKEFGTSPPAQALASGTNFADNTKWFASATTVVSGQADPVGGTNAQNVLETATTAQHYVQQTVTKAAGTATYRLYVKAKPIGARNFVRMQVSQASFADGCSCYFNISTGTYGGFFSFGAIGTIAPFAYPLENGFVKIGFEIPASAATDFIVTIGAASADGTDSYLGDVTKGMVLYDAKLRRVL